MTAAEELQDWQVTRQKDDAEMIKRPHLWPHLRVLPLKRVRDGKLETAVIWRSGLHEDGSVDVVENTTLYGPVGNDDPVTSTYARAEDVVQAGWMVD